MLIHDFMTRYLVATRNVSQNTVLSYRDSYVLLLQYLNECCGLKPENLRVQDISSDRVKAFLEWIEEMRGCSIRTRNLRLVAIHSLFRYIAVQQPEFLFQAQQILAIPEKKTVQALVSYLPATDIEALLAAPDSSTSRGLRDQAMLCCSFIYPVEQGLVAYMNAVEESQSDDSAFFCHYSSDLEKVFN